MIKAIPTTKDQLVYYLLTNISLGTYDKRFLTNIQAMHLVNQKPVTTNQSNLLDKITDRYRRQLAKKELDATELIALSWSIPPVASLPQFTEAHISIKDDTIIVQSPFKSAFVKEFKEETYSIWNKETRSWHCMLSEETLKGAIDIIFRHYDKINYSDEVLLALNTAAIYDEIQYWNPTLVQANGRLYIAAINKSLSEAISHIELNTDLSTIANLVHYGIAISEDIKSLLVQQGVSEQKMTFACGRISKLEYDATLVMNSLLSINPDFVLMSEWFGVNKDFTTAIKKGLADANIQYKIIDRRSTSSVNLRDYKLPIILSSWSVLSSSGLSATSAKTINLVNSNPIKIK